MFKEIIYSKEIDLIKNLKLDDDNKSKEGVYTIDLEQLGEKTELNSLLEYISDKVKENYPDITKAFAFFDVGNKSEITNGEFSIGLKALKIILDEGEIDLVFSHLDQYNSGILKPYEFRKLFDNQTKNWIKNKNFNNNESQKSTVLSIKSWKSKIQGDYKDFIPISYKPVIITNKRTYFDVWEDKNLHGIYRIPSDNIKSIINHDFEKEFIKRRAKRDDDQITKLLLKEENLRGMDTKTSVMRSKAIKEKLERQNLKRWDRFRLKYFDEVKPSNYISETTKNIKKKVSTSSKRSNFDTESVLKIAKLTNQLNQDSRSQVRSNKQLLLNETEVQNLEKEGAKVHRFDMRK